ncbi:hypothetical protein [Shinella kummerowiae]|uniref:hypothetical protein n=1 Tax=Shinella kummerowiae TaxID=417745 RepID=UPI0021B65235|nr:hypothetical protein [Shinella kummerowiae]MCT7667650.1 hypothetical protein [Shinella kummerowiae]
MARKISIVSQIFEVDREIAMRERVYPREVQSGKLKKEEAEMLMERIHAVRATLVFCKEHEADIRAYIAAKKAGAA